LDEQVHAEERVLAFGLGLEDLSKEEVSGIDKEYFLTLLLDPGDQGRFLGDPAKRVSKSPTGLNLSHHIIGVDEGELGLRCPPGHRGIESGDNKSDRHKDQNSSVCQFNPHLPEIPNPKHQ
jgi:hypothetical protein